MSSNGSKVHVVKYSCVILAFTVLNAPAGYAMKASFDMPACDRMTSEQPVSDPAGDPNMLIFPSADMQTAAPASSRANDDALSDQPAPKSLKKLKPVAVADSDDDQPAKPLKKTKAEVKEAKADKANKGKNGPPPAVQVTSADLLSPMKLTDDSDSYKVSKDGKIKLQAQRNVKNENNPLSTDTNSVVSNDAKLNNKLLKQAKKELIEPLALVESQGEAQQKLDIMGEADKQQLTDLWSATINRSPDVQFVINRMQPHTDPNHATSTVIKLLSGVLFSAAQAVPMMMGPGMGSMAMYGGIGSGGNLVQQLLYGNEKKNQQKQNISQEQATMLYKMVRDTADKLVIEFRNYKKCRSQYERSAKLLDDIKTMVTAARDSQDAAKQIDMEYTIRKAQHDLDDITDDARLHRQQLSDLSGADAVAKLDEQIDEEMTAINAATGGDAVANTTDAQPAADNQAAAADAQHKPDNDHKELAGTAPKTN
jgi:hypothetical protein